MTKFCSLHFNVHEVGLEGAESVPRGISWAVASLEPGPAEQALRASAGANDEMAARRYLESFLGESEESSLRSLIAPERASVMPDLRLEATVESPLTGTRLVKFSQTSRSIPIFGTRAVVEIDGSDRSFVAVDANLADVPDVSPLASVSAAQALEAEVEAREAVFSITFGRLPRCIMPAGWRHPKRPRWKLELST